MSERPTIVTLVLRFNVRDAQRLVDAAAAKAEEQGIPDWASLRTGYGDDIILLLDAGSEGEAGYTVDGVWWKP